MDQRRDNKSMESFTREFEIEYDGQYYQIEAEYVVTRSDQSHAFGVRVLEDTNPVNWVAYSDGARIVVVDAGLADAIWRECDRYAD